MNNQQPTSVNSLIYYRLIALWVLNEAMLGGIIHGLKIPVSGLIVGSCAVLCICLIGWYVPKKGAIIKATLIVAIFKMMLSPQAPPPAYIAVFFQGLMGELLFRNRKLFKLSCLLFAILALVESGLQRILVLTIIYGNDLWKVINDFISNLSGQKTTTNYSLFIGAGYVLLHLVTGLLVGWWASTLPFSIKKWSREKRNRIIINNDTTIVLPVPSKRKKRLKKGLLVVWIILVLLYVQSWFNIGKPILPSHVALKILLRSSLIVLSWIFLIGPLLKRLLHYWLQKKRLGSQPDIQNVLQLLPSTQQMIAESWKRSAGKKGFKRINAAAKMILVNTLTHFIEKKTIFILTAPVQTGKTTSLINWSENRNDMFGIVTPVVNGKRMFMDVEKRHLFAMEAIQNEKEVLNVGRFVFSKTNFEKAIQTIREAMNKEGWLIIDEIGPLELKGEGFCQVLKEVLNLQGRNQKLILVVREGMAESVKDYFALNNSVIITSVSELES